MINKHLTLHPQYFLKEGFGTLMSHYSVMYSLYRDTNIIPTILNINFKSQNLTSAMEVFNNFNEPVIYHHEAFVNFKNIFHIIDEPNIGQYNWIIKNLTQATYDQIVKEINSDTNNSCCLWSLNSDLTNKYLNDIINYLYIFNNKIINYSKNILPSTTKQTVGICVRNEYKKFDCPHIKLSLDFYIKAMEQFDINNSKYIIFSDDIDDCKNLFSYIEHKFDLFYTHPMQSSIGLCSMSMCDHIICANSSFSYWAAMLNKNKNKKIICSTNFIDKNIDENLAKLLNYKWYPREWTALDIW